LTLYLDTSVIVALLAAEPASERLQAWLSAREADGLATGRWTDTEVASALSLKVRIGEFTLAQRAEAAAGWRAWREGLLMLDVEAAAFEAAAAFASRPDLGLRAGDALHLAVAAAAGCALVTLDERMAKAAPEVGVPVADVGVE
jgi:predicted nucleic acid-binding protein